MKKIVFIFAVLVSLTSSLFSQEVNISFENKVSSDIIVLEKDGTSFPGIEEKVTAEFETEKIDAGVSLITTLSTNENDILGFNDYFIDKAYIVFKPIDTLRISFNNNIFTEGSYLPVWDDNISNGNLSNSFAVLYEPLENLVLSTGLSLPSFFTEDLENKIDFNAGIDYSTDFLSAGVTIRSLLTDFGFGIFGSFIGVPNLTINAGFSYNDDFNEHEGNLVSLGCTYDFSNFTISFDHVTVFNNDQNHMYNAILIESSPLENLTFEAQEIINLNLQDSDDFESITDIGLVYSYGNHNLRCGAALSIYQGIAISFPVYYKYSF